MLAGCRRWPIAVVIFLALIWISSGRGQSEGESGLSKPRQPFTKVPSGVILVKGAWSASTDSSTPLPENGTVARGTYKNQYFGLSYALPNGSAEMYQGPPPSDSGRYVLAQIQQATTGAQLLITAQDMFFSAAPLHDALQWAAYEKDSLQSDYKVELPITATNIAGRPFSLFSYWSPVAQLHWYVLATEVRCHTLEFVFTSRDSKLLNSLVVQMNKMSLPPDTSTPASIGGSAFPVCIKDYAAGPQSIRRVDPILAEHRFNPVPVRIIIDTRGTIKHIHFLSAFPDQQKAITDALKQWRFKPYLDGGRVLEVETGVMFGAGESGQTERSTVN
ncbi:MAG: hypothetical protein JOZ80_19005 [Acidobacteriaceae bacterium]|nr:hypothetical protein [Acidobacteriaceae bacterium]